MPSFHTHPRRTFLVVVLATLGVLVLLVTGLTWRLRSRLRAEVLQREAEAIYAVAAMEISAAEGRAAALATGDETALLFTAALQSSRLRGVMALQLFDPSGGLREALPEVGKISAEARWWSPALEKPVVRYHPRGPLEEVFGATVEPGAEPSRVPLVEIVAPLRANRNSAPLLGAARYWVDGAPVAAEFARMDRSLFWQAALAWVGAAAAVALVLAWALARLAESSRRLAAQSEDLARANQELDFAAKTGALGAISAHLIHGLKNPLAGLEGFVSDPEGAGRPHGGEAWRAAVETTRRLRALVQEVATVLRDEREGSADHRVPVAELLAVVQARAAAAAAETGVTLAVSAPEAASIAARVSNLAGLILANLLTNSIEASSRGAQVTVTASVVEKRIEFIVADSGGGLSPAVRAALFQSVRSTKRHGGGVGLAISRRLARHAGGELELAYSDRNGAAFRLSVPRWTEAETPLTPIR